MTDQPTKQNDILAVALAAMGNTSLVMGELASGKSTHTLRRVKQYPVGTRVLWLAFDNVGALETELWGHDIAGWEFQLLGNYPDFKARVASIKGQTDRWNVIVVEGLHTLANLTLNNVAGGGTVKQSDWGDMGKLLQTAIVDLRDNCDALYVTCAVVENDEAGKELGINRDLYNRIMPLMGKKMYAATTPAKMPDGTIGVNYTLQVNPTLAIRLKPAAK